jgi:hypothetical protein
MQGSTSDSRSLTGSRARTPLPQGSSTSLGSDSKSVAVIYFGCAPVSWSSPTPERKTRECGTEMHFTPLHHREACPSRRTRRGSPPPVGRTGQPLVEQNRASVILEVGHTCRAGGSEQLVRAHGVPPGREAAAKPLDALALGVPSTSTVKDHLYAVGTRSNRSTRRREPSSGRAPCRRG